MSEVVVATNEKGVSRLPVSKAKRSLMTPVGLAAGDILLCLERCGSLTLRHLIRMLPWPAPIVMMAVGSLIREGLVLGVQHDLELVLEV